jgi:hypothetical protein
MKNAKSWYIILDRFIISNLLCRVAGLCQL